MAANKRKILETARKHAQKGAKDKALKEYEKLLKLDPRDAKLRLEIGDSHRRWGQITEAVEIYTTVAEQFMKEGFDARAVAVFKQIQNLDSDVFSAHEPLSELYQRMGLVAEAINTLQAAADGFYRGGDKQEALGLLRKMATIDPSNTTSRLKVADLLHQEGMDEEAVTEYDGVAEELEQQGDGEAVGRVFERILEIQPERVSVLCRYARSLMARGAAERAESLAKRALAADRSPEQFELLADVYRATGRDDELVALHRELAELYLERGDAELAREILQRYVPPSEFSGESADDRVDEGDALPEGDSDLAELTFDDEPTQLDDDLLDDDLLTDESLLVRDGDSQFGLLADPNDSGVLDAGDTDFGRPSALSAPESNEMTRVISNDLSEVSAPGGNLDQLLAEASVYLRYGKRDQAIANLESIIDQEPEHRPALEKLGEAHAEGGDTAQAVELWSRAVKLAANEGEPDSVAVLRTRIAALDPAAAEALDVRAVGESDTEERLIVEDPVESPDDVSFSPQLDTGDPLDGEDLAEIDLEDIEIDVDAASFVESPTPQKGDGEDSSPEVETAADALPGSADAAGAAATAGPSSSESTSAQITEDLEEADFYLQQGLFDEAETIYKRVLSIASSHPHALVRLGEVAAQRGDDPGSTATGLASTAAVTGSEVAVSDEPVASDIGDDLADWPDDIADPDSLALDDVDADLAPSDDDATPTPKVAEVTANDALPTADPNEQTIAGVTAPIDESFFDLTGEEPGEPLGDELSKDAASLLDLSMEELPDSELHSVVEVAGRDDTDSEPSADTRADLGDPEEEASAIGFDLAAELSEALDDESGAVSSGSLTATSDDGFAAVFAEFKKGVSETLSEGDHEAHYDLGIAYREMGLLGDAIDEFRAAMADPGRTLECLHMMGHCALDQGEAEQAVGHFREALATADISDDQRLAGHFELGRALEASGEIEAARDAYQTVSAVDLNFCDVEARLAALDDPEKDEAPAANANEDTAEYETFEEFLGEDDVAAAEPEPEPPPESFENFDDVIADVEADDLKDANGEEPGATVQPGIRAVTDSVAEALAAEIDSEPEPVVEVEVEPEAVAKVVSEPIAEVAPRPGPTAEPDPDSPPEPKRRKKKKISFV